MAEDSRHNMIDVTVTVGVRFAGQYTDTELAKHTESFPTSTMYHEVPDVFREGLRSKLYELANDSAALVVGRASAPINPDEAKRGALKVTLGLQHRSSKGWSDTVYSVVGTVDAVADITVPEDGIPTQLMQVAGRVAMEVIGKLTRPIRQVFQAEVVERVSIGEESES